MRGNTRLTSKAQATEAAACEGLRVYIGRELTLFVVTWLRFLHLCIPASSAELEPELEHRAKHFRSPVQRMPRSGRASLACYIRIGRPSRHVPCLPMIVRSCMIAININIGAIVND
jgi:hypothetical protein